MGGAAVVYRHAAGLAERGHDVTVAAPQRGGSLKALALRAGVRVRDALHRVPDVPLFDATGVDTVEPASWRELRPGDQDAVIATGYQTAGWVHDLTADMSTTGFYFLQGDERPLANGVEDTWDLPLTRIAVSQWVAEAVRSHGRAVAGVVPNAVDADHFGIEVPIDERRREVVALYHRHPVKGPDVLIGALHRLRNEVPDVRATVISARPPRHRLPRWVNIEVRPTLTRLREIYNRSAVCLHTSRFEGWGLVPMEAAACGCAVVATASGGPGEYLRGGWSMVEVAVGDVSGLAGEAGRLLCDGAARARIARAGVEDVGRFSWAASTDEFERLLLSHAS